MNIIKRFIFNRVSKWADANHGRFFMMPSVKDRAGEDMTQPTERPAHIGVEQKVIYLFEQMPIHERKRSKSDQ